MGHLPSTGVWLAAASIAACARPAGFPGGDLLEKSSQHVVVVVERENDSTGTLYRFTREGSAWRQVGGAIPAAVGARGVAKTREGDKKAPTGAYPLPRVFGYAASRPEGLKMPYLALRPETECVDDAKSDQYNRVVNPSDLPKGKTWSSSEIMRRDLHDHDDLYKLGLLVDYNPDGRKGAGSCIFLHIWRGPAHPTVGCTAFSEQDMLDLLQWLDPAASPILVQGTRADLDLLRAAGHLPYDVPRPNLK